MTSQDTQVWKALIMVIDDNPDFLSGIELTLELEGYKVWKATNGQHALDELKAAFTNHSQDYPEINRLPDLILSDIMMPVMDGYDLYDEIHINPYLNHIPFVFLTAKSNNSDVRKGKELGIDDYLPKSSDPEDILATVRGKLKRIESRWTATASYAEDVEQPRTSRNIIFMAIIFALLSITFWLGATFAFSFFE